MGKKKKKKGKNHKQATLSFMQQVGKVIHRKGTEIALALATGIVTNLLTDAGEILLKRYVHRNGKKQKD